jgi:ribosomal protein S18 acetylase RimI-like enzyme
MKADMTAGLMPMIPAPFRRATPQDVGHLAQLVQFASEGLALYLWSEMAGAGHDPWVIGRARTGGETHGVSYKNAVIAEIAGQPAAALIGYPLPDEAEPASGEPAILAPLHELMNLAANTWYLHVLATYPEYRGSGQGSALLALADNLAAASGKVGLGLIVSDTNAGARKLYQRCGYREAAQRRMVKERWQHPGTNWVLMRKQL